MDGRGQRRVLMPSEGFRVMRIVRLRIYGFRGVVAADIHLPAHAVLVGPTSVGKSTVIDALSLVCGRDQMVRDLTEHDFHGSSPTETSRIRIVATISEFKSNDPDEHDDWFRVHRGISKWWSHPRGTAAAQRSTEFTNLAVEIAFAARFDHATLEVERMRYFHDDDDMIDPFSDEGVNLVPGRLTATLGYFVVPASRNWDRLLSFSSEIFRKLVVTQGAMPAEEILRERDRLRSPTPRIEDTEPLKAVTSRINEEFGKLLPDQTRFELRITATDSQSVMTSLYPHFRYGSEVSLPSHRHGSGLLSLQTLIVLLEFGRARSEGGENFILAVEEPELHLAPGLQRRVVHRARTSALQTICTTHAPRVASFFDPTEILVLENERGNMRASPILKEKVNHTTSNAIRKLIDGRAQLIEALLHEFVIVPEGRSEFELFRLLVDSVELSAGPGSRDFALQFSATVGVAPTPDGHVATTFEMLTPLRRARVFPIVDGDDAGDGYIQELLDLDEPPTVILQWRPSESIEDVVGWIVAGLPNAKFLKLVAALPDEVTSDSVPSVVELIVLMKRKRTEGSGLKMDLVAYETICQFIADEASCIDRADTLLRGVLLAIKGDTSSGFRPDPRSTESTRVLRWSNATAATL
jgi:putative ATP-dependent endonuclease of OLD family